MVSLCRCVLIGMWSAQLPSSPAQFTGTHSGDRQHSNDARLTAPPNRTVVNSALFVLLCCWCMMSQCLLLCDSCAVDSLAFTVQSRFELSARLQVGLNSVFTLAATSSAVIARGAQINTHVLDSTMVWNGHVSFTADNALNDASATASTQVTVQPTAPCTFAGTMSVAANVSVTFACGHR